MTRSANGAPTDSPSGSPRRAEEKIGMLSLLQNVSRYERATPQRRSEIRKSFLALLERTVSATDDEDELARLGRAVAGGKTSDPEGAIDPRAMLRVFWATFQDPLQLSQEIAAVAGVGPDAAALRRIYGVLRGSPLLTDILTHDCMAARAVSMLKEASRIPHLVDVVDGRRQYVARLELWLGLGCQYICNHCFSTEVNGRGKRVLVPHPRIGNADHPVAIEELERVIDEGLNPAKGFCIPYFLFSGGKEPLAPRTSDKVCAAVEYIRERERFYGVTPPRVVIYTNGIGLTQQARDVCVSHLDSVRISLDGATTEPWENTTHTIGERSRGRVCFASVVENILELVELRNSSRSSLTIRVANLLLATNYREWRKMLKLALLLGVDVLEFKRYIGWPEEIGAHEPPEEDLVSVVEAIRILVDQGDLYRATLGESLEREIVRMIVGRKGKSERALLMENAQNLSVFVEDSLQITTGANGEKRFAAFFHQSYGPGGSGERPGASGAAGKSDGNSPWARGFPRRCLASDLWLILGPRGEVSVCTPMLHARIMRDVVLGQGHPEYVKGVIQDYDEDPLTNMFGDSRERIQRIDTRVCFYRCDHSGINYNWILRKMLADREWGIDVDEQPFDPSSDRYLSLTRRGD